MATRKSLSRVTASVFGVLGLESIRGCCRRSRRVAALELKLDVRIIGTRRNPRQLLK